jgi:hypothetical protein
MFKVGEKVFDINYKGEGVVEEIRDDKKFPVIVSFGDEFPTYTIDGRLYLDGNRTLYHHDYTPVEPTGFVFPMNEIKATETLTKREQFAQEIFCVTVDNLFKQRKGNFTDEESEKMMDACIAESILITDKFIKALNEK